LSKKILIVGGTGFLGYHLARKCVLKGWLVTSISTKKPKKIRYLSKVKYLILDITKKKLIEKKIKLNYDYVVNLAGYVNHSEKIKTYQSHFWGCQNLVDFFLNTKIKSFIQIGSCVEYGNNKSPQSESDKTNIQNLKSTYGKAKLSATNYLLKKYKEKAFPCTILRLYLIYGPGQDFNRFVPLIVKGCLQKNFFACSAGTQYRDFLYIDDFISSIFKCLKNERSHGQIFNIGSGKPKKIKKIILLIKNLIKGGQPEFGKIELRKDEIFKLYPNIKKGQKILNWIPKVSFATGIEKTISFYKKNLLYFK
jgi:nucleoside-diphosphate-sugar epimerase